MERAYEMHKLGSVSLMIAMVIVLFLNHRAVASDFRFSPRPNKASLIHWRDWDKKTFEEAKTKDKLILLSLSAVWCHWCHVMDETTYSDMEIINFINQNFIPVRVDSDRRPDIDSLYNQGGWPSTVILTQEGEILMGGTYIPPKGMMQMLSRAVTIFTEERETIHETIETLKKRSETIKPAESESPGIFDLANITKLIKNRTTIIVAHRLSTIKHADKIVVLHKGEIKEIGKHEELLKKGGMYYDLYKLQVEAH